LCVCVCAADRGVALLAGGFLSLLALILALPGSRLAGSATPLDCCAPGPCRCVCFPLITTFTWSNPYKQINTINQMIGLVSCIICAVVISAV
jgi:hypothetical protein